MNSELVYIGESKHILREVGRAVLFSIGTSNTGAAITKYIPKSQLWRKGLRIYIPMWLAKEIGIWQAEACYECAGYTRVFEDDDLPF